MDKSNNNHSKYELIHINSCGSTNDIAWEKLNSSQKKQCVIVSDSQTSGRGRRENNWFSNEESLTFSIALTNIPNNKSPFISLITGIAIVNAINNLYNLESQLKWPNDIMIKDKKVGGVLVETKINSKSTNSVVGIGLNINQSENQIPVELKKIATSLKIVTGSKKKKTKLLNDIINNFFKSINYNNKEIIKNWELLCYHINKPIKFHENKKINNGIFLGLYQSGSAKILVDNEVKTIESGIIYL